MAWSRVITPEARWMAWRGTKDPFSPVVFGWLTTISSKAGSTRRVHSSSTCFRCATMSAFWRKNTMPKNIGSWEIFRRRSLTLHSSTVLTTSVPASKRDRPTTAAKLNRNPWRSDALPQDALYEESCRFGLGDRGRSRSGACAGYNRLGHEPAPNFCQFGSYSLRVGGTAADAERQTLQHNRRSPAWSGGGVSGALPVECFGGAKRACNGRRCSAAPVGNGYIGCAHNLCVSSSKGRTACRSGYYLTHLAGGDADSTGRHSHHCRRSVGHRDGRAHTKASSQACRCEDCRSTGMTER